MKFRFHDRIRKRQIKRARQPSISELGARGAVPPRSAGFKKITEETFTESCTFQIMKLSHSEPVHSCKKAWTRQNLAPALW